MSDFIDQKQAAAAIFEYIEGFYNKIRAHSTIGYRAPTEFDNMNNNAGILKKSVLKMVDAPWHAVAHSKAISLFGS